MSLDSEQAMSFQITLLLTSFVYLDVINQQIPVFQNFDNTPMILIFFATVLVIQVALIVGTVWNTKKTPISAGRTFIKGQDQDS